MAHITHWKLIQNDPRAPVVDGEIHMKGQFTKDEWARIRHMFFTMRTQPLPAPTPISREEAAKLLGIPADRILLSGEKNGQWRPRQRKESNWMRW